jgi:hypothetical protein
MKVNSQTGNVETNGLAHRASCLPLSICGFSVEMEATVKNIAPGECPMTDTYRAMPLELRMAAAGYPQKKRTSGGVAMKELIEGLLFVALLKYLGVPGWFISLGAILYLIGFFAYMSTADSRRKARELAAAAAREKQQAERKEAERVQQEAIADAEWNARFV